MSRQPEPSVCILCIDLDSGAVGLDDLQRAIADAGISVTWGVNPNLTPDIARLASLDAKHEIALLADLSWAADASNRRRFADQLTQSLRHLAQTGSRPTTLIMPNGHHAAHADLLVKHGMRLLCVSKGGQGKHPRGWWAKSRSTTLNHPCTALRWGLWQVVTACDVAHVGVRGAQRVVDRLSRDGGLAIVRASVQQLVASRRATETLLAHLARRRSEGVARFETLADLSATLSATRTTPAARSILRSAAA